MVDDVERMLQEAREQADTLANEVQAALSTGDWAGAHAAQQQLYAAEREVAGLAGQEYAVELDLPLRWDTGAPLPHLVSNGHTAHVLFYLADTDPSWDGTWVRVVDPSDPDPVPLGVVTFHGVHSVKFGGPNDEAIEGHPLSGKGLRPYAAHRVLNSRWITEAERINSVHWQHRGGWHDRLNHYVFCFHDETLECLADRFTVEPRLGSPRAVLKDLVDTL